MQTSLDLGFTSGSLVEAWVWMAQGEKAQLQCGVEFIPTGAQKVEEVAAATWQEQINSPKVTD